jgi:hypothetical protein
MGSFHQIILYENRSIEEIGHSFLIILISKIHTFLLIKSDKH